MTIQLYSGIFLDSPFCTPEIIEKIIQKLLLPDGASGYATATKTKKEWSDKKNKHAINQSCTPSGFRKAIERLEKNDLKVTVLENKKHQGYKTIIVYKTDMAVSGPEMLSFLDPILRP